MGLKEEVSDLSSEAETACAKAKDIKVMLECSRARVLELEEDQSRSSSTLADEGERLRNTKTAMAQRCRQMEAKIEGLEKEGDRLRKELQAFAVEDERRTKRQNQAFIEFKKRTAKSHSSVDQKL